MTENDFGGGSSVKALEWLRQYKKLADKKMMGLSPEEAAQLKTLELKLAHMLDPKAKKTEAAKRNDLRVSKRIEINFKTPEEVHKAYIKNISGGGLYLETDNFQPVGSLMTIYLNLPSATEPEPVECMVAWVNPKTMGDLPKGMGLKFKKISETIRSKIQRFVDSTIESELKVKNRRKNEESDKKK